MAESVMAVVVLLLALYGCVQGVRWLVLRLMCPPPFRRGVWLIPLFGHTEDAEYLIRRAAACRMWNAPPVEEVYIVDVGADKETRDLAQRVSETVNGVRFLSREQTGVFWEEFFRKIQK